MKNLYLVHDEEYSYKVIIKAYNRNEAIEKLQNFLKETKQTGEFFIKTNWIVDLCDNDFVIK